MSGTDLNMLLDNIVSEQNYKSYLPETDPYGKLVRNIDALDDNKKVYTFESSMLSTSTSWSESLIGSSVSIPPQQM